MYDNKLHEGLTLKNSGSFFSKFDVFVAMATKYLWSAQTFFFIFFLLCLNFIQNKIEPNVRHTLALGACFPLEGNS